MIEIHSKQHECRKCGAMLKLTYAKEPGFNEKEEYSCPKCNEKCYVKTSGSPNVQIVEKNN